MKDRPYLNILSKEIYEANKLKGWHEQEYSNEHYLCLVISELMEAVEAYRRGKIAKWDAYDKDLNYFCNWSKDSVGYKEREIHAFSVFIKDTIEDELADAVIRLLDLAGVRGIESLDILVSKVQKMFDIDFSNFEMLTEKIEYIISGLYIFSEMSFEGKMVTCISNIELLCQHLSIDLWLHVELKLKYNLTRPYKHGKEY